MKRILLTFFIFLSYFIYIQAIRDNKCNVSKCYKCKKDDVEKCAECQSGFILNEGKCYSKYNLKYIL